MEVEFETRFVTAGSLLYSVEHRPWLPPSSHWFLSQRLNDQLYVHFAIAPQILRRLVPAALTLDLYDGVAWLTISAGCMSHLRPTGVPPLPGLSFFSQLSVRTYVTAQNKPGLFSFSVDAGNLSAVWFARVFYRLPYWHAKMQTGGATIQERESTDQWIYFRSARLHGPATAENQPEFDASYLPEGEPEAARRGTLDDFLLERYCMYSWNRGKLYRTEIHHQPWPLQRVSVKIRKNSMAEPLGLTLPVQPNLCHFSRSLKMLVWAPERVSFAGS